MSVSAVESGIEEPAAPEAAAPTAPPRVEARRHSEHAWVWQVTALSVVLGVMLALALRTTSSIRKAGFPGTRLGVSTAVLANYRDQSERLQREIKDLRAQVSQYEANMGEGSKHAALLQKELQDVKGMAGLAPVEGPGLRILLRDSIEPRLPNLSPEDYQSYLVHDQDINGLLHELKAAGAESLAISGADTAQFQRVVATTSARCVGPTAVVNGTRLAAPYTILAIGNPKELRAALEMPEGFIQVRGLDVLKMIVIEEAPRLVLPAYSGSFSPRYARPSLASP